MKKEIYEKLGAKEFQRLVFKVEKIKWKLIKTLLPNYTTKMEAIYKRQRDKALQKAKTQEEINSINSVYKNNVMAMKQEYNTEQNINYHINMNNPSEIINYLNSNKTIHKSWLLFDATITPILVSLLVLGNTWTIPFIVIVGLEVIKNFECINLQNYSLACYEEKREKLERYSQKNVERRKKKYGEAQKVIIKVVTESEEVPSIERIIEEAQTKESLEQLKMILIKERENRKKIEKESNRVRGNVK